RGYSSVVATRLFWELGFECVQPYGAAGFGSPLAGDHQLQCAPPVLPGDFRLPTGPHRLGHILDDALVTGNPVRIFFHPGDGRPGLLLRQIGNLPAFNPVGRRTADHRRSLFTEDGQGLLQIPGIDGVRRLDNTEGPALETEHRYG